MLSSASREISKPMDQTVATIMTLRTYSYIFHLQFRRNIHASFDGARHRAGIGMVSQHLFSSLALLRL